MVNVADERPVIQRRIERRARADDGDHAGSGSRASTRANGGYNGDIGDAVLVEIANGGCRKELEPAAAASIELPGLGNGAVPADGQERLIAVSAKREVGIGIEGFRVQDGDNF